MPSRLPPKSLAKTAVDNVKNSNESTIVPSTPAFVQAKDALETELKDFSKGVGNQLESARSDVKNTLDVISERIDLTPEKSIGSSTRPESLLQEMISTGKDREQVNLAEELATEKVEASASGDVKTQDVPEREIVGEIKTDAVPQEVVRGEPASEVGEIRTEENDVLAQTNDNTKEAVEKPVVTNEEAVMTKKEPVVAKEKSSFSKSLSGSASALADPKFETFRLDDLFPGESRKLDVKKSAEPAKPKGNDRSELMLQPVESPTQRTAPRRTEEQVVEDLKKNSIPSRVVFDNTPAIAEQLISKKQIVLHAVATKHALVDSPAEIQSPIRRQVERMEETQGGLVGAMQMIQVKSQQRIPEPSIDFSPLPELSAMVEEFDLSLESSDIDGVYNLNRFPTQQESEFVFEGPNSSSLAPGEFSAIEKNKSTLPTVDKSIPKLMPTRNSKSDNRSIILRAVPASTDIRNAIRLPQDSGTKATFQFVQPKFQRVIDDE